MEQEYFSEGISEDIITDLSKVPGLLVIARNSSFAYKGKAIDLRNVGRELGVGHVLEGSVRRAGGRVRITAQLIDAAAGGHLWADRFDRDMTDIFAVQDEVTLNIVEALKIQLTPAQKAKIASTGSKYPEAYDLFMRMRDLVFSPGVNEARWDQAQERGRKACELDPSFAQTPALMSIFHAMAALNGWGGGTRDEVLERGMALAERSIAIDPEDPLANTALAAMARFAGDYETARQAIEKALSVTPDSGIALFNFADLALVEGRPQEAVPVLEPLNLPVSAQHIGGAPSGLFAGLGALCFGLIWLIVAGFVTNEPSPGFLKWAAWALAAILVPGGIAMLLTGPTGVFVEGRILREVSRRFHWSNPKTREWDVSELLCVRISKSASMKENFDGSTTYEYSTSVIAVDGVEVDLFGSSTDANGAEVIASRASSLLSIPIERDWIEQ